MGKSCSICGVLKELSQFSPRGAMRDGHRSDCKTCCCETARLKRLANPATQKEKDRRSYQKHRQKRIAATQLWYANNTQRSLARGQQYQRVSAWQISMAHRCKAVAKKKRLDFDLDAEFIESLHAQQDGRCYWLGVKLQPSLEVRNPLQPSIDRIDCSKGYTKDNVVLSCQFANMGRSAMTAERFREFVGSLKAQLVADAAVPALQLVS